MAKKKRSRQSDREAQAQQDDTDVEMEATTLQEEEADEPDADSQADNAKEDRGDSPFMDAFYRLTVTDPRERALAAQTILWHIQENPVDAKYAWQRLLRGLGSGRAAARQGNASALSLFLKIGIQTELIANLQKDDPFESDEDESTVLFVRRSVLAATKPPSGKKNKGSDERDAFFGRLFGIVAVIRSGILFDQPMDNLVLWCNDLAKLYHTKKWMREPTAHAVCLLLQLVHQRKQQEGENLVVELAMEVIIPEFLREGDNHQHANSTGDSSPLAVFSTEQLALAILLQSLINDKMITFPAPWNEKLLSSQFVPVLAPVLASTSHVTQPRVHLVWDVIAMALTESTPLQGEHSKTDFRRLKTNETVLVAICQHVLQEQLLGLGGSEKNHITDDRRALALCIVRQWAGVEFVSSLAGRTILQVPGDLMTTVLSAPLVQRLFIELVSTHDHYLKPLAAQVLQQITDGALSSADLRIAVLQAFLSASSRFDSVSKTESVATLLGWRADDVASIGPMQSIWEAFIDFAQRTILEATTTPYEAAGMVDLLFHHGKHLVRLCHPYRKDDSESPQPVVPSFIQPMIQRICCYFLTRAFFDCSSIHDRKNNSALVNAIVQVKSPLLAYDLRCVLSSRFYSLLAEQVTSDIHAEGLSRAVEFIQIALDDWHTALEAGATPLGHASNVEETPVDDDETPLKILGRLRDMTDDIPAKPSKGLDTFLLASYLLSSILYLHLLNCGTAVDLYEDDDPDVDDPDDDREDIEAFLRDVQEIAQEFHHLTKGDMEDETDTIVNLAEVCVNIMSSPLTFGNRLRGASPKMLREVIRQFWIHGLLTGTQSNAKASPQLLTTLLDALGASPNEPQDISVNSNESDQEIDIQEKEQGDDENVFYKAASLADEDIEMKDGEDSNDSDDGDEEIHVDDAKLQSLLEEDDDASVDAGELEHHAGADAALARLIDLKQEGRKAGQLAREKIEISNNIRCVVLLETLLMGKAVGWGTILSPSLILSAIVPLLDRRRSLERSVTNSSAKEPSVSEKRVLLERITSLLRQRVFKTKISSMTWSPRVNPQELIVQIGEILLKQSKERISKDHAALLGSSLAFIVKALPETKNVDVARNMFANPVREWANKKSARMDEMILETFIRQATLVSQQVLTDPLTEAAVSGKTAFLRMEAFRLLSLLFTTSISCLKQDAEDGGLSTNFSETSVDKVLVSCTSALRDPEMNRGKRLREVLKALDKALGLAGTCAVVLKYDLVQQAREAVQSLESNADGELIQPVVEKLSSQLLRRRDKASDTVHNNDQTKPRKKKKKGKKKRS